MKLPIRVTHKYKEENIFKFKKDMDEHIYHHLHRITWKISDKDMRDNFENIHEIKRFLLIQGSMIP